MAGARLFLIGCLMCACVQTMAGYSMNCSTKNPNVEPRKNKRLSVSIIANVTAKTIQSCASSCLKRSACRSFNYNLNASRHQCQLNEFDHENETQDDPNYMYSPISDWNPRLVHSCANHTCPEDSFCVPAVNQNYTCLHLHIQCRSPKRVENAEEITWPYPRKYKSEIKHNCKRGYRYLSGVSQSICQLNWEWSEVSLKCSRVICGIPPNKTNAELKTPTGLDYGNMAYYKCRSGYTSGHYLSGVVRCTENGTWTDPNLNCTKISCGSPLNSSTAVVTTLNGTSVGDVAIYSCIKNAILKSSENISVCSSDGNWTKPVECGFCPDNNTITYQGKQVCYERSDFAIAYDILLQKHNNLIATEEPVIRLFKNEAIKERKNVFAGFSVNSTHVSFVNSTTFSLSKMASFNFHDCRKGVCVYNTSGVLTYSTEEAYSYTIHKPN